MSTVVDAFCRVCLNSCAIKVTVEDGVAVRVTGNRDNPVYRGYTCVKGRSQPQFLASPERLRHALKRGDDGDFTRIPVSQALDEISAKLAEIIARDGPRAVAGYCGTMGYSNFAAGLPLFTGLMDAIGTPMRFDPNTLDKGGKQVAQSLIGTWLAPSQGFDDPRAIVLIGTNPLMTYTGFPAGSPHTWLKDVMDGGCQLIVIDPRATDVAKKATIHLSPAPGHDAQILAAFVNVILTEDLYDREFVAENVRNIPALRAAVDDFTPEVVAGLADVSAEDLRRAARLYAMAPRGYVMAGTGPNMSGWGTLVEYLVQVIETLCGRWLRAGEVMKQAPSLLPEAPTPKAQAQDPLGWELPELMRVRGLRQTQAGMPLAALPDEILTPGAGQVRALINWGGNPVLAFPDQAKTIEALEALELLVVVDPWMTATARYADYIIAPTMPLETPSMTSTLDALATRATGYGLGLSYAQYAPAVSTPPPGSDLIEDWEIFYELIVRLGHHVTIRPAGVSKAFPALTLAQKPTTDELLELLAKGSRIPLATVKARSGGDLYPEPHVVVAGPDPLTRGRLDVGNALMMAALRAQRTSIPQGGNDSKHAFRLLCRRNNHMYNSSGNVEGANRGVRHNPAYLNPTDLAELGIEEGSIIRISSDLDSIPAIAAADGNLRRGVVSMAFAFGPAAADGSDVLATGSSPNLLAPNDEVFDSYTGQPRMSNIPVSVALL